jgi:cellulose synthase/poly-beta-1,6-N-acetylglucosamine synthase-like glycosyltransferase
MTDLMKPIFVICCFMIIYPYVLYPLVLRMLSYFRTLNILSGNERPLITFIISAFNEEDMIGRKIENTLSLNYPKEKLEIIVVSDNSTDRTDEIVKSYDIQGVILLLQPVRKGKTAGLNDAVKKARGEILIFSDADSMYETDALKKIAGFLSANASVGLVTGSTHYHSEGDGKMVVTTSIYTRLERFIKQNESKLGSCVGADGAIFAMRKSLYKPLLDDDINDLVIPFKVVKQGYRVVFHDNLFCTEAPAADESGEFKRQTRITNRTLRALFRNAELMNIFKYPLFGFELISHKLLRFSVPFFMLALLPLNTLLLGQGTVYYVMFAVQIAVYSFSLFNFRQERAGRKGKLFGFLHHFVMVNVSMLLGWIKFISGQKNVIWDPQRQQKS